MRFLKLTRQADGASMWFNSDSILAIERGPDGGAFLYTGNEPYSGNVNESPEEILAMLNEPTQPDGLLPGWRALEVVGETEHFDLNAHEDGRWFVWDRNSDLAITNDIGECDCLSAQKAAQACADRLEAELKAKEAQA